MMNRSPAYTSAYSRERDRTGYDCRTANWSYDEVDKLVEIWSDPLIQHEMETTYRNFPVYEKISNRLTKYGIDRSGFQCRVKLKNLKSTFTKAKDTSTHDLDVLKTRLPYFYTIENIMTHKIGDIAGLTAVLGDFNSSSELANIKREQNIENEEEDCEDDISVYNDPVDQLDIVDIHSQQDNMEDLSNNSINQNQDYNEHDRTSTASMSVPVSHTSNNGNVTNSKIASTSINRKRKRIYFEREGKESDPLEHDSVNFLLDRMDKMQNTFLDGFKNIQNQMSEERKFYMECEERRLKFFAELEEKRRRDEREHELRLFQLFTNILQGKSNNSNNNNNSQSNTFADYAAAMTFSSSSDKDKES